MFGVLCLRETSYFPLTGRFAVALLLQEILQGLLCCCRYFLLQLVLSFIAVFCHADLPGAVNAASYRFKSRCLAKTFSTADVHSVRRGEVYLAMEIHPMPRLGSPGMITAICFLCPTKNTSTSPCPWFCGMQGDVSMLSLARTTRRLWMMRPNLEFLAPSTWVPSALTV